MFGQDEPQLKQFKCHSLQLQPVAVVVAATCIERLMDTGTTVHAVMTDALVLYVLLIQKI